MGEFATDQQIAADRPQVEKMAAAGHEGAKWTLALMRRIDAEVRRYKSLDNVCTERAKLYEAEVRARKAAEEEVEDEIQRRDRYHDAVTEAHVALGSDGEWRAHVGGSPEPPHSGHLHLDVPVMARQLRDRIAALEAELAEAQRLLGLYRDECHVCGVESCRHRGADHEFKTTEEHWAKIESELAEAKAKLDAIGAIESEGEDWTPYIELVTELTQTQRELVEAKARESGLHDEIGARGNALGRANNRVEALERRLAATDKLAEACRIMADEQRPRAWCLSCGAWVDSEFQSGYDFCPNCEGDIPIDGGTAERYEAMARDALRAYEQAGEVSDG